MPLIIPTGLQSVAKPGLDLNNLHTVVSDNTYRLFRSARPTEQGLKDLIREVGLRTVISFENESETAAIAHERAMCERLGLKFISRPMRASAFQEDNVIEQTVRTVAAAARRGSTLVHCLEGRDRTGLICAEFETQILGRGVEPAVVTFMRNGFHGQQELRDYFEWKHSGQSSYLFD